MRRVKLVMMMLLLVAGAISAQESVPSGFFVELLGGFNKIINERKLVLGDYALQPLTSSAEINRAAVKDKPYIVPSIGYTINDKVNVGFRLSYSLGEKSLYNWTGIPQKYTSASLFSQYKFIRYGKISFFSEFAASLDYNVGAKSDDDTSIYDPFMPEFYKGNVYRLGASVGASLQLTNHVSFQLEYMNLSLMGGPGRENYRSGKNVYGNEWLLLDFGKRTLRGGIRYQF